MHTLTTTRPLLAALILLAGFALRLALATYHGIEGDGGFSLALTRLPLTELIPGVLRFELDIHPPLHAVILKGWLALTGDSLLTVRLLNIWLDVLTGALMIRLGGRLFGARAGLAAGLLWAAAPLLIFAGWLVRMYTLLTLAGTAGAVAAIEALRTGRSGWYVVLFGCALAALYTHIVGVIVVGAVGAALLIVHRRQPRRLIPGVVALGAAGLLWLPVAIPTLTVFLSGRALGPTFNTTQFATPLDIPGTVLVTAVLHRFGATQGGVGWALLFAGLTGYVVWRERRVTVTAFAMLTTTALVGLMLLAAADFYRPRYLAPVAPLVLVMLAGGVMGHRPTRRDLSRPLAGVVRSGVLIVLILSSAAAIRADLNRALRDDWLAATGFIAAHEHPGDRVIVIPDWGQEAFKFHYTGAAPVTGVLPRVSADLDVGPILDALTDGYDRLWLVRYQPEVSDPDAIAPAYLSGRAVTVTEVFPAGMRLLLFDLDPVHARLPAVATPLDATFGGVARLHGFDLPLTSGRATDSRLHPPNNRILVTTYWAALAPGADFTPQVRLTDPRGQVWGAALANPNDTLARHPVATWEPGDIYAITTHLNINPATPPGRYNIEVMALRDAQPLPAAGPDAGANWVIAPSPFFIER